MNHSKNEQLLARKAAATPRGVGVMGTFFAERARAPSCGTPKASATSISPAASP